MRWALALAAALLAPTAQAAVTTDLYALFPEGGHRLQVPEPMQDTEAPGTCIDVTSDPVWTLRYGLETEANGTDGFRPEPGLGRDLILQEASLVWSLRLPDDRHLAVPLRLKARMVGANFIGDPEQFAAAPVVAEGETPGLVLGQGTYDIPLGLQLLQERISKSNGMSLVVTLIDGIDCASPADMRAVAVSSSDHRSRLKLTTSNGVFIDYVHPAAAEGVLLVHAAANSPYGASDLDLDNFTLRVEGPSSPKTLERYVSQNNGPGDLSERVVEVTWVWRFRAEGAADGDYRLTVMASNLAHTSTTESNATFRIAQERAYGIDSAGRTVAPLDEEPAQAPLPGLASVIVALVALGLYRARRR